MMRQTTTTTTAFVILSCLLLFAGEQQQSDAFQQQQQQQQLNHRMATTTTTTTTTTRLSLLPEQGNQLAAAYNAAASIDHKQPIVEHTAADEEAHQEQEQQQEEEDNTSHWRAISTSKSFLNRLFHKPSATKQLDSNDSNTAETATQKFHLGTFLHNLSHPNYNHNKEDEIYLYPIIGFQFVKGCQDALPTLSHASIRIPTKTQKEEEVVGWYTKCCKLDLFSDDVCHSPTSTTILPKDDDDEE
jgi:hypothetical protein